MTAVVKHKSLFICGTDTGVGKTIVMGALCAWLNSRGIRAGAYKPLESGCSVVSGMKRHIRRADSEFLKRMARMPESIDLINPYYFREALAPGVAAEREGRKISFSLIKENLNKLKDQYDIVFIEGAGGLLVPVAGRKTHVDLIKAFKCPVILVARLGLGTINHTLLTLENLKSNRIEVRGVILNELKPRETLAERTNSDVLNKFGVPLWGIFPYAKKKTRSALVASLPQSVRRRLTVKLI